MIIFQLVFHHQLCALPIWSLLFVHILVYTCIFKHYFIIGIYILVVCLCSRYGHWLDLANSLAVHRDINDVEISGCVWVHLLCKCSMHIHTQWMGNSERELEIQSMILGENKETDDTTIVRYFKHIINTNLIDRMRFSIQMTISYRTFNWCFSHSFLHFPTLYYILFKLSYHID